MLRRAIAVALLFVLAACATTPFAGKSADLVVLVSIASMSSASFCIITSNISIILMM